MLRLNSKAPSLEQVKISQFKLGFIGVDTDNLLLKNNTEFDIKMDLEYGPKLLNINFLTTISDYSPQSGKRNVTSEK